MPRKPKEVPPDPDIELFELYGGEVKLRFKKSSHRTVIDDCGQIIRPSSVTTILGSLAKPALVAWGVRCCADFTKAGFESLVARDSFTVDEVFKLIEASREAHNTIKQEAAGIGILGHDWLQQYWTSVIHKTDKPEMPPPGPVYNCVNALLDWVDVHHVVPIAVEQPLYSRIHKVTGRLDLVAIIDGERAVLDNKSTKQIWPEVALQEAAYAKLHDEEYGTETKVRWAVRMDKLTGEFEGKRYPPETLEEDWETFLAVNLIHERLKFLRRKPKEDNWMDEL